MERSCRVDSDGTSRNYYDPSENLSVSRGNSQSNGISGGLLLRLGNVETNTISSTKTYSNVPMIEWKYVETKAETNWVKAEYEWVTMGEVF